jgi:hypothetical protein
MLKAITVSSGQVQVLRCIGIGAIYPIMEMQNTAGVSLEQRSTKKAIENCSTQ